MNVWGDEGGDGVRLLRDLERCQAAGVIYINLSFRNYRNSLDDLLDAIYRQATGKERDTDICAVLRSIQNQRGNKKKKILLMISEIDPLYESSGNDNRYDENFVYSLNHFNDGRSGWYLLLTSKESLNKKLIPGEGDAKGSFICNSNNTFQKLERQEILAEINRETPEILSAAKEIIASHLLEQSCQTSKLEFYLTKYNYRDNVPIQAEELQQWDEEFTEQNTPGAMKKFDKDMDAGKTVLSRLWRSIWPKKKKQIATDGENTKPNFLTLKKTITTILVGLGAILTYIATCTNLLSKWGITIQFQKPKPSSVEKSSTKETNK